MAGHSADGVLVCPPERHVGVPSHELVAALKELLPAEQQHKFGELWRIMTELTRHDFADVRRSLLIRFGVFSAATSGRSHHTRSAKTSASDAELDRMEQEFLAEFVALMEAGHYRLLDNTTWDIAQSESFMFSLPVAVQWDKVDGSLVKKYWSERQEARAQMPEISDNILLFHRGLDVVTLKGYFLGEKADLLIGMAVREPLAAMWAWMTGRGCARGVASHSPTTNSASEADGKMNGDESRKHRAAKTVERKTLRRLFPTLGSLMAGLGKEVELVEPSFKDVVILYREKVEEAGPTAKGGASSNGNTAKRVEAEVTSSRKRNLHIKRFQDIPMADVEMVFPDKAVGVNNVTLVSLIVTVVAALAAGGAALLAANADGRIAWQEVSTVMSIVGMLLARCLQVYLQMQANKRWIDDQMQRALYLKSLDSQEGLVLALLDEMEEQLNRQALLAFFVLLRDHHQLTDIGSLDARVEQVLEEHFGCAVDFAVEVALCKLHRDDIISVQQNRISALSLDAALHNMDARWDNLFNFVLSGDSAEQSEVSERSSGYSPSFRFRSTQPCDDSICTAFLRFPRTPPLILSIF